MFCDNDIAHVKIIDASGSVAKQPPEPLAGEDSVQNTLFPARRRRSLANSIVSSHSEGGIGRVARNRLRNYLILLRKSCASSPSLRSGGPIEA
jgi:hypothetical protein